MTPPAHPTISIRAASRRELDAVAGVLIDAYTAADELTPWLVPNAGHRRAVLSPYFARVAQHLLYTGLVEVDHSLDAVALWRHAGDPLHLDDTNYSTYLTQTFGTDLARRITALETEMFRTAPPSGHHHYLAFLAVRPSQQGRGLACALLGHHAAGLDRDRISATAHALGPDSQHLLARHGFIPDDPPAVVLPAGPRVYPMYRAPQSRTTPAHGRRR